MAFKYNQRNENLATNYLYYEASTIMKKKNITYFRLIGMIIIGFFFLTQVSFAQSDTTNSKPVAFWRFQPQRGTVYDANPHVTLDLKEVPIDQALKMIADQVDAGLYYNSKLLPAKKLTLHLKAVSLSKALQKVLAGTSLKATTTGRNITLQKRKMKRKKNLIDTQQESVSGTVTDAQTGDPLVGVNILVVGTSTGTATDAKGHYSLNVPLLQDTLRFSYIGYETQTIPINGRTNISISLEPHAIQGQQLVVVGFGTQEQSHLTGSVSTIDMEKKLNSTESNVSEALEGKLAGVHVVQTGGGKPGGGLNIHVRGIGTINSQSPLYIINGVPVKQSPSNQLQTGGILNTLDPSSLQSITVLKGASASAIYGSRASGGVVIIKTKQGQEGPVHVSINSSIGAQIQPKRYNVMNADQYADYIRDLHSGPNGGVIPKAFQNGERPPFNTNWQDAIFRPGTIQNYNMNISGGSDKSTYAVGLGYYDETGTMIGSGFKRYSIQTNLQYSVSNNIEIGGSLMLGRAATLQNGGVSGSRPPIQAATRQAPTLPIYDSTFVVGYAWPASGGEDENNPVGYAALYHNKVFQYTALGSFYGSIDFLKHFTYKAKLGFDYGSRKNDTYNPSYEGTYALMINSARSLSQDGHLNPVVNQTLKYKSTIGKNDFTIMGGFTIQSFRTSGLNASGEALPTGITSVGSSTTARVMNSSIQEHSLRSILGRITYSYANKYLLTANIRRDESSKLFNTVKPIGVFPSVSVGWRISEEPFLANSHIISNLKLRAGWGELGNQSVLSDYPATTFLNAGYYYVFNNKIVQGIGPHQRSNKNITWERDKEIDVGADIGLLGNSVSLTLDYYHRTTSGLLWQAQVPLSVGLLPSFINAGSIVNSGVELSAKYNKTFGEVNIGLSGNISTIHNKVTSLGQNNQLEIREGDVWDLQGISITKVGHPVGQFYGYVVDGIFQNWDQVYNAPIQNQDPNRGRDAVTASTHTAPGDFRFKDISGPNGKPDGVINSEDKTIIGNPIPDFTYGFTVNLGYKNFDFNMFLQGTYGNDIFNAPTEWLEDLRQNFNQGEIAVHRWTPQHHSTIVPRANPNDPNRNITRVSSLYVQNGSYMRVKTLTVGYTLSPKLIKPTGASNIKIYVTARNLFTISPYRGLEPSIGSMASGTALDAGIDRYVYPQAKQFMFGVRIRF
jgi:TonB-linked SusC/RagA family outer membrane protein